MLQRRAFIYTRISLDRTGEGLGVERQLKACRAKAKALGWTVVEVFEENDTSASKGRRPVFAEMMRRLDAGEANALIAWSLDRLTRRPREIEDVLDLSQERGVALSTCSGEIDLGTAQGRTMARIGATFARQEVEVKSERQRAANTQQAESGRPHAGRRAFGYTADGLGIVPEEAGHIRWAAERLLAGGSIRGIVAELGRRGAKTTAGGPWKPTEFRRMLANPRYAGIRIHREEVIDRGVWEPILDEDTHNAVRAILTDPSRQRTGQPRRYLLSGLALCAVCGARCYGVAGKRGPLYFCESRKHIARRAEHVETLVHETMIERLSRPDAAAALARSEKSDHAGDLRTEERGLRARLDGLAEAFAAGDIDPQQMRAGSKRLRARLEVVAEALATLARKPALSGLLSAADVRAAWEGLDIDTQREIIGELLTVTLHSPGRGARTFAPDTVGIAWKSG